jgi:hypothetical protein
MEPSIERAFLRPVPGSGRRPILPRLIVGHLGVMAVILGVNVVVPYKVSILIDIVLMTALPVLTAMATGYLIRLYRADTARPRSELFAFLAYGSLVITVAMSLVAVLAVVRVLHDVYGVPFFPTEATTTILVVALELAGSVPIMKAILFRNFNRDRAENDQIPPMRDGI